MRLTTKSGSNQSYREYGSATLAASVLIWGGSSHGRRSVNLDWPDTVAVVMVHYKRNWLPSAGQSVGGGPLCCER